MYVRVLAAFSYAALASACSDSGDAKTQRLDAGGEVEDPSTDDTAFADGGEANEAADADAGDAEDDDASAGDAGPRRYVVELPQAAWVLTNESLLFAPTLGAQMTSDISAYTRQPCARDASAVQVAFTPWQRIVEAVSTPVHLTEIEIEQRHDEGVSQPVAEFERATCFAYRSRGLWTPIAAAATTVIENRTITMTLTLDAHAVDAIGIFLPTYTTVTRVAYRAEAEP